jgi:hypothetical protein
VIRNQQGTLVRTDLSLSQVLSWARVKSAAHSALGPLLARDTGEDDAEVEHAPIEGHIRKGQKGQIPNLYRNTIVWPD